MPWKNVKVRADLHEMVARRARQETRSVAQMTDRLLMRALEQETENLSVDGEAHRGTAPPVPTPSSARAPVAQRQTTEMEMEGLRNIAENLRPAREIIERQTTVDEMLASCPNCAGELTDNGTVVYCSECAYVREGT
jgi:hypothetical protein